MCVSTDCINRTINSHSHLCIGPGVPYEVVVVAFTSVGRGEENDRITFFSEELEPSKAPENVTSTQLNETALNITWIPLTLEEARGFPEYRVSLATRDASSRRKRQSNPDLTITTNNSFAVFTDLSVNTDYSAVVGVRTGVRAGTPSPPVEITVIGMHLTYGSCKYKTHTHTHIHTLHAHAHTHIPLTIDH